MDHPLGSGQLKQCAAGYGGAGVSKEPVSLMENYLLGCETRDSESDQAF